VFPESKLAPTKEELHEMAGYWSDIEKSRTEARRLLKEAGAEGISFELLNRDVDQPYKYIGSWLIDQWSKIGLKVTQRVVPSGPWFEALRSGNYDVAVEAPGHGIVNPLLDVQKELPASVSAESYGGYEDPKAVEIYDRMLRETDPQKQKALMLEFETHNLDTEAHQGYLVWWNRIVPYHAYVKGWKVGPSHLANQDLATVWLDR
jgi:peptide/nickel transport system substrate-binding protein